MDELKLLIDMVAALPAMALWVLVGFFAYKVVIIGSIYGVIRLGINKLHDYLTRPRKWRLASKILSDDAADDMNIQLMRVANNGGYISAREIMQLKEALDIVLAKKV